MEATENPIVDIIETAEPLILTVQSSAGWTVRIPASSVTITHDDGEMLVQVDENEVPLPEYEEAPPDAESRT